MSCPNLVFGNPPREARYLHFGRLANLHAFRRSGSGVTPKKRQDTLFSLSTGELCCLMKASSGYSDGILVQYMVFTIKGPAASDTANARSLSACNGGWHCSRHVEGGAGKHLRQKSWISPRPDPQSAALLIQRSHKSPAGSSLTASGRRIATRPMLDELAWKCAAARGW